jgi:S1-C subfamily serine protease
VPIERRVDLRRAVGDAKIGSKATITVWRKGAQRDIPIVIGAAEVEKPVAKAKVEQPANALGLTVTDLTDAQRRELRLEPGLGVLVESAGGTSARAGLQPGDVLLQLDNSEIRDAKSFAALVVKSIRSAAIRCWCAAASTRNTSWCRPAPNKPVDRDQGCRYRAGSLFCCFSLKKG